MELNLDVAWLVGCAGLVFLMQPGFMCLESGLTHSKNNINVAIKNLTDFAISVMVFWLFSYSLMFGQTLWGWVGHGILMPELTNSAKLAAFFLFQAMFCGTATTIISGAVAERMRYKLYLVVCCVISGLIYPVFGHWAWNGLETGELGGWLRSLGFVDFAGSTVVHSVGGWVSLAAILVVGPRAGRYARDGSFATIHHSNLPFSVLGAMLLWLGWLGFNGGSTLAFDDQIPRIIVQTIMAGTAGLLSAMALGWYRRKLPEVETTINGSLAGLVAITAGCNAVSTQHAVLIGAIAGLVMILATDLMNYFHIDDGVDAVAVHGFCGVWGTVAVALFGDLDKIGTGLSRHHQVAVQLLGVGVAFVWAFGLSYLLFRLIDRISPLRVTPEEEELGLNVSEHGAKTELYDLFQVMDAQAATQDYSLRVPSAPYTEVGKIAQRYNQVMATVESYAHRLRSFNAQLEEKVQQRTQEIAQANQELIRLSQVKDRFLANTSHELRTPLHGIVGLADSMLDGDAGELSGVQRENLAMIAHSGRRLANLVNDILDYSQLQRDAAQPGGASRIRLQRSRVQLHSIVALILTMSEVTIGKKNVALVNAVPADLPLLWVDVNRLQQILYNLVGNAIKFTPAGEVRITAQLEAGETDFVAIWVADTGIGIPMAHQQRIFESFEQADGSMARQYGGSGLGLTVAKQLIERHGGNISVKSRVGGGSTFRFTMPIYDASREPEHEPTPLFELGAGFGAIPRSLARPIAPPSTTTSFVGPATTPAADTGDVSSNPSNLLAVSEAATLAEANHRRFKILIVDDEPVNLQVLMNQLSPENYAIFQTTSGMDALAKIEQGFQPDLVLLDVMMPNMTGYEVCQQLRERFPATALPILMLTAKSQLADIVQGFQEGANDYLTKPIQKQELLARMRTHLHLSNLNLAYSRFVPQQFLRLLKKESILDVSMGDQVLQEMSILFSDIRNFTPLSEQMTPQENFRFINRYFSYMEPAIAENHGFIDKYIGDGIMALFARGPDDAVQAAIAMLQHLVIYNQDRREANQPPLEIGLGINTGELMLGTVGGQSRIDSTVIGDVVNVAARLEELTKLYKVPLLISEFTQRRLRQPEQYDLRWVDRVQVRGKVERISVYEVFDADPQEIRDQKQLMQPHWEVAIACFQREDYEAAQEEFEAYLALLPGDPVAQLYIARCREKERL